MNVNVRKTGDWRRAAALLHRGPARIRTAANRAVRQEAQMFRKAIVQGIRDQAPGGKAFKPLAPSTLAVRRLLGFKGTKALIRTGELRNSVSVLEVRPGEVFIGVRRSAQGKDGRSLVNIAEIHERGFGPFTVSLSNRAVSFLMKALSEAGIKKTPDSAVRHRRIVTITIPARPFLQPVFDDLFGNEEEVRKRVYARISRELLGSFGRAVVSVPER